ncbi:hypothetical protein [Campylobacter sp. LR264d]|nr:hypothetical protein [Campylobacter sp. LR264d]
MQFNGLKISDFLKAHGIMMKDLSHNAGNFRVDNVGIFGDNELLHLAPC